MNFSFIIILIVSTIYLFTWKDNPAKIAIVIIFFSSAFIVSRLYDIQEELAIYKKAQSIYSNIYWEYYSLRENIGMALNNDYYSSCSEELKEMKRAVNRLLGLSYDIFSKIEETEWELIKLYESRDPSPY